MAINAGLPPPDFIWRDPERVVNELVAQYESLTDKKLYPAQLERCQINAAAYRESLVREAIQDVGLLCLIRFSRAPILDYLAEGVRAPRLMAVAAQATIRFTLKPTQAASILPAGTLVACGEIVFATKVDALLSAGAVTCDVVALCARTGVVGNGFAAGQINTLLSTVIGLDITHVANIDTSASGADAESDEHLITRALLAAEQYATAGPNEAYVFWTLSAHQAIVDVTVLGPSITNNDGVLASTNGVPLGANYIYPLAKDGLPSQAIKDAVFAKCNAKHIRPMCDYIEVRDPVVVDYAIEADLTLFDNADAVMSTAAAKDAATKYVTDVQSRLGKDIVTDDIIEHLRVYGVYSVNLRSPAVHRVLNANEWPRCTGVTINIVGRAAG